MDLKERIMKESLDKLRSVLGEKVEKMMKLENGRRKDEDRKKIGWNIGMKLVRKMKIDIEKNVMKIGKRNIGSLEKSKIKIEVKLGKLDKIVIVEKEIELEDSDEMIM